ncbi:L,D-transpeptidase [Streptomyces sp. NBC_01142]|uniref:L,D-transpeptidase n=1 Tax=Streptomyces sp. NBC_01142 TaxID=2975865 RepID=UPI00224F1309|nr:L,D-transpeptidase [Streptomyces sp. NBC_01142]MCX4818763.1 L,D-transpeptidase [Streptomyces sp. NBC_01142]
MSRSSSGLVAGLTAAALAVVGFLAYQAQTSDSDQLGKPRTPQAVPSAQASGDPLHKSKNPQVVPADSGAGVRVVYSLSERRVWLVGAKGKLKRTFEVMPSTVTPRPGTYKVTSRSRSVAGSDGVQVEHVVRFTTIDEVSVGFSAAVDGSMASPDPERKTGGVRMKRADGNAVWTFATVDSKVVVIP